MLNMIRMELYRMFKTKSMYVIWLVMGQGFCSQQVCQPGK